MDDFDAGRAIGNSRNSSFLFRLVAYGLGRFVSEPPIPPLDQNFALRHASVIHAALTPQGNRYWVTFGGFRITGLHVIGADRDRDFLACQGHR
jgi:hypothetical protein